MSLVVLPRRSTGLQDLDELTSGGSERTGKLVDDVKILHGTNRCLGLCAEEMNKATGCNEVGWATLSRVHLAGVKGELTPLCWHTSSKRMRSIDGDKCGDKVGGYG